jgi:nucleotide-binding universal stress UspA family protein
MNILEGTKSTEESASTNHFNIKRIIVAVDLSPAPEKTANYAAEFARNLGASITLLHIFPPEPSVEFASEQLYESYEQNRRVMIWKLMELVEQVRRTGVKCDYDCRVGDPAEEVTLAAHDSHADLIIAASHRPGLFRRLFGMDQAPRILYRASCPVLVYHEGNQ